MTETTQEERGRFLWRSDDEGTCRECGMSPELIRRLLNDADRLAAIERKVRELVDAKEASASELHDEGCELLASDEYEDADRLRSIIDAQDADDEDDEQGGGDLGRMR